jgi:hypothetical protein
MLWALVVIILILWLLGFMVFSTSSLIHLLLVVALAIVIYNLVTGRGVPPP